MSFDFQELIYLLPPLLFFAVASGWYAGRRDARRQPAAIAQGEHLSAAYFRGLNFLLNEQPDKAIEVFIKVLEVNSDTVETHLALGNLFRRRGEVERAIRIHQNLIARPTLDRDQRALALLELGQDYLKAGLFDRAENLFSELVENRMHSEQALRLLLHIYQQEKEWMQATATARRLSRLSGESMSAVIAHYHCEIALNAIAVKEHKEARRHIRKALSSDPNCVRANIILGDIEAAEHRESEAIRAWKRVADQDPQFLGEVAQRLTDSYRRLGDEDALYQYLGTTLKRHQDIELMMAYVDLIKDREGIDAAEHFVEDWLRHNPSVHGLRVLIELNTLQAMGPARDDLLLLRGIIEKLGEQHQGYVCVQCGFRGQSVYWLCPSCNQWNTIKPLGEVEAQ